MTGNEERVKNIANCIEVRLEGMPEYMSDFYHSMTDVLEMTKRHYVYDVEYFLDDLKRRGYVMKNGEDFAQIRSSRIAAYIDSLDGGDSLKRMTYFALKRFFMFLFNDNYIQVNPMMRVTAPKVPKQNDAVALTPEEIKKMMENIAHPDLVQYYQPTGPAAYRNRFKFINRNLAMVGLALTNGLRCASIVEINVSDLDFENKQIKVVQKGDRYHTAVLSNDLIERLKDWLCDRQTILDEKGIETDALFIGNSGKRLGNTQFNKMLAWATFNIDKTITVHKLRSTCATSIYEATGNIYLAQQLLGHASVKTTQRYISNNGVDQQKREAVDFLSNYLH